MEPDSSLYLLFQPKGGRITEILKILEDAYKETHTNGQQDGAACGSLEAHEEIFYFTTWKLPSDILEKVYEQCRDYETFADYFELEKYVRALLGETENDGKEQIGGARQRAEMSRLSRAHRQP